MKSTFLPSCVGVIVVTACLVTSTAFAGKSTQLDLVKKELRAATAVELPAKAANLVSQAKLDAREATAEIVVTAVNALRPVALIAAVSAIARDNPDVAAVAAAKAAALQPKQAAAIAYAASSAAPAQAGKIANAVCKAVPALPVEKQARKLYEQVYADTVGGSIGPMVGSSAQNAAPGAPAALAPVSPLAPPAVGLPFSPVGGGPIINRDYTAPLEPGSNRSYGGG